MWPELCATELKPVFHQKFLRDLVQVGQARINLETPAPGYFRLIPESVSSLQPGLKDLFLLIDLVH